MQKRYVITVTEIGEEKRIVGRQWKEGAGDGGSHGYTPETEATRDYEREIFKQTVPDLDLSKLVITINS
ncbi:hypothetical protein RA27_20415 [Ruegeria sp. ANG-R]|uniref:hypothetical protein n=1 Tax=Ruegeria sp. ANG-R TaxID=1577903 RepID=UPI0005805AB8|nr:hypothetical protein [Ruegeria sp. ANG-R]KIC38137.1 hypothetical protein RA27_20415 [Ruegeria sp. ANG-R]